MTKTTIILCLAGIYSIAGAIFDWDWFMNRRGNSIFTTLVGRSGARIIFAILGAGLIALGIYSAIHPASS